MNEWPERYKDLAMAWLDAQWNEPSRTDYYLMRVAQRLQQQWSKKQVSLKDQEIKFEFKKTVPLTREEKIARSKAIWMGGVEAAKKLKG